MANVLTYGAWLSAPTKNPSFLARLLRVQIESRQRRADRVVEEYIATHGLQSLSDWSSVQLVGCFLRGASNHGHTHHSARGKKASSLWKRGF